jgi:hypothetical protein
MTLGNSDSTTGRKWNGNVFIFVGKCKIGEHYDTWFTSIKKIEGCGVLRMSDVKVIAASKMRSEMNLSRIFILTAIARYLNFEKHEKRHVMHPLHFT